MPTLRSGPKPLARAGAMRGRCRLTVLCLALTLSACAGYSRLPLPEQPDLAAAVPAQHESEALDMDAVATIAVLNNADLRAARVKASVAEAQAFAAGLLPDPQFSASLDRPRNSGSGYVDAYGLGLNIDLQALLTHSSKTGAANAARDQARLELLWQEWQTVAQARSLFVLRVVGLEKYQALAAAEERYAAQAERSGRALQAGDVTLDQSGGDLALLSDIRIQRGAAERDASQADHALHALLGLAPDAMLRLQSLTAPQVPLRVDVESGVARLAQSRPDLRALQAGYESQEKLLHKAVLSQFPNISVGFTKARDTSDVRTIGVGATLNLPLFDRGRGEIAVQRATRDQLRAEYQARLDQAIADVWRLWDEMQQLQLEIRQIETGMPESQAMIENAQRAHQVGDLAVSSYVVILGSYLTSASALFDLRQSLWSAAIAMGTVLGTQIEPADGAKD